MKRASYRAGVAWIADHDESHQRDLEAISAVNTTRLLAELFGRDERRVAVDVLKLRVIRDGAEAEELVNFDFEYDGSAIDAQ
jgi:hypothetical protein